MADKQFELSVKISAEEQVSGAAKSASQGLGTLENSIKQQAAAISNSANKYNEYEEKLIEARTNALKMSDQQKQLERAHQDVGKALGFLTTGQVANNQVATQAKSSFMAYAASLVAGLATFEALKAAGQAFYKLMLEQENVYRRVAASFGNMSSEVIRKSEEMARGTIFETDDIMQSFTDMHDMVSKMGLNFGQESELMQAAMNLAAIKGKSLEEVIGALDMAMVGNTRAARSIGLVIDENTVKNSKYGEKLKDVWKYLNETEKAQVTLMVIQEQAVKYTDQAALASATFGGALKQAGKDIKDFFEPYALGAARAIGELNANLRNTERLKLWAKSLYDPKALAEYRDMMNGTGKYAPPKMDTGGGNTSISDAVNKELEGIEAAAEARRKAAEQEEELEKKIKQRQQKQQELLEKNRELTKAAYEFTARQYELTDAELSIVNNFLDIDGKRQAAREAGHVAVMGWIDAEYQAEMDAIEDTIKAEADKGERKKEEKLYWNGKAWIADWGKNLEEFQYKFEEEFLKGIQQSASNAFGNMIQDSLSGNLNSGLDLIRSFSKQAQGLFSSAFGGMAAQELMAGTPGAGMAMTMFTTMMPYVVNMLNGGGSGPSSQTNFNAWLEKNLGISSSGANKAGWFGQFTGQDNFQASMVFDVKKLKASFQELNPVLQDAIDLAYVLRNNFGQVGLSIEESTAQILTSIKETDMTLAEFATAVRDFYAESIIAGKVTGDWGSQLESFNESASRLTWLSDLKTEMATLMESGYEFTDAQIEQMNRYIDLIKQAENGNLDAYSELQTIFSAGQAQLDAMNASLTDMQANYQKLQSDADKLNGIISAAQGLETNINQLLFEKSVNFDSSLSEYADSIFGLFQQVNTYREQFAGNDNLLSAVDQYYNLSMDKLLQQYLAADEGNSSSGFYALVEQLKNVQQVDITSPLETQANMLAAEIAKQSELIAAKEAEIAAAVNTVGERIIAALNGEADVNVTVAAEGGTAGQTIPVVVQNAIKNNTDALRDVLKKFIKDTVLAA